MDIDKLQELILTKDQERDKIQRRIDRFLSTGGVIKQYSHSATNDDPVLTNNAVRPSSEMRKAAADRAKKQGAEQ